MAHITRQQVLDAFPKALVEASFLDMETKQKLSDALVYFSDAQLEAMYHYLQKDQEELSANIQQLQAKIHTLHAHAEQINHTINDLAQTFEQVESEVMLGDL